LNIDIVVLNMLLCARLAAAVLFASIACSLAADADAWKSRIVYFTLTDRFAKTPGSPSGDCQLTGWNNGELLLLLPVHSRLLLMLYASTATGMK
jgi:hypothetical protein